MAEPNTNQNPITLLFLPLPSLSHFIPMVELAKTLLHHHHNLHITILTIEPVPPSPHLSSYITSIHTSDNLTFHRLPTFVPPSGADPSNPGTFLLPLLDFQKPHVKSVMKSIGASAIVVDMFCADMVDVAGGRNRTPCYVFFTANVTMLGLMLGYPNGLLPEYERVEELETVRMVGVSAPMPAAYLPSSLHRRDSPEHDLFLHFCRRYSEVDGFIVNSYAELQPQVFKELAESKYLANHATPTIYPVGPLISTKPASKTVEIGRHECLEWLDMQPTRSVVFICFGSADDGFSEEQAHELTNALGKTPYSFLWVHRGRSQEALPEGFLKKTEGRGLVWPDFAPQEAILEHRAIGGFVTHCGWNSIMESLWFGVPMLAWPLHAEQHMNAFEMVTQLGVAVDLEIDRKEGNWVTAEELQRGIRCLMDDCEETSIKVRANVMKMKEKGRGAKLEGGSSFASMEKLVDMLSF